MIAFRRKWVRVLACVLGVVLLILLTARLWLGAFVAKTVNAVGPVALGVPVSIGTAAVDLFSGRVHLKHIEIGNPEGFDTPYLFHLDEMLVDLDLSDCLRGTTHVSEIVIRGPRAWYHQTFTGNNISAFLDILNEKYPPAPEVERPPSDEKEPAARKKKPVVIDHLLVEKGSVGVKLGAALELPLPEIELNDIGKDGAMMPGQVAVLLTQSVVKGVLGAVSGVGGLAAGGIKTLGSIVADGARALFGGDETNALENATSSGDGD